MKFNWKILLWFFASYWSKRLYRLAPQSNQKYHLFPFYPDMEITLRTWAWFACDHLSMMLFIRACYLAMGYSKFMNWLFLLECMDFCDYLLRYNTKLFFLGTFALEYDDLKLLIIGLLCIHFFTNKRRQCS